MTKTEETIGKVAGTLLLLGVGWIGTMISANNAMTMSNQVALSENKILILEIQKDIQDVRHDNLDSKVRIGKLETAVAKHDGSISYIGKKLGL